MKHRFTLLLILASCCLLEPIALFAQTYNDGPIQLQVRLRDIRVRYTSNSSSDFNLNVGSLGLSNFEDDELTFFVWAQDNSPVSGLGWGAGSGCRQANLQMLNGGPDFSPDYNVVLYNNTYPAANVPQYVSLRLDAWEDDVPSDFAIISGLTPCGSSGSRCTFNTNVCCLNIFTCIFREGDDIRCDANPFKTDLDYRFNLSGQGIAPCAWYNHGYIAGNCPSNNFYQPRIETYYRFLRGTACNNAISLGNITVGTPITHFNSNSCYSNAFPNSPGNDVFYSFNVTSPIGINASLCGINGAQFDSYLYFLNTNCVVEASNDNGCGSQSTLTTFICQPGTYYLVVDGATANAQGNFTLTITPDTNFNFRSFVTKRDAYCFGSNDGWAKVGIQGGTPPYTYQWTGGTGGTTTDSVYGLPPGKVYVTIVDDKGCTIRDSATIIEPTQVQVTMSATNVSCSGYKDGTATVNPSGGTPPYTYLWITTPLQGTQTAIQLGAGTYTVNVIDRNGCVVFDSVTVNTTTQITLTTDLVTNVSCNGADDGAVSISMAGGNLPFTYAWSHGPTTDDVTGLAPGQYSVTAYDQDSCFVVGTYNITEPPLLSTQIIDTVHLSCNGGSDGIITTVTQGGTPPYTYLWSNGRINPNLLNVAAGTYTLTVTDALGCTTITTQTLNEPAPLNIIWTVQNPLCFGQTNGAIQLNVTGGTAPYDYLWTTNDTTRDVSGLGDGVYGVLITDTNNCLYFDFAVLFTDPKVEVSVASATNADCNGNSTGEILLDVIGGLGSNYIYTWSNAAATGQNPTGLPAGTYGVTVADANGCSDSTSATITEPLVLLATITNTLNVTCNGVSNGAISVDVTGGTQPYVYAWNSGSTNEDLSSLPAGSYQLTVTDANNCVANTPNTVITEPLAITTSLVASNPSCPGATNGSITLTVNGGTTPYVFNWSNGAQTQNASNLGAGTYTVVVTDAQGCVAADTITLANTSELEAVATITDLSCSGGANGTISLAVTGGTGPYSFNWSPAQPNSANITGLSGGFYDVTITDAQGCFASFSYEIEEPLPFVLSLNSSAVTCFGDADGIATSTLNGGTPNYNYSWSDGQTSVVAVGLNLGPISLTVTDGNGCTVSASTTITGPTQLVGVIDSVFDVTCFDGFDGSVFLGISGGTPGYLYSVQNNVFQNSPSFFGLDAGDYSALVLDSNNCRVLVPFTIAQPAEWELTFKEPYVFISRGADVKLEPLNNSTAGIASYTWSPADGLSCTDCESPDASPLETTTYTLVAVDSNGCESVAQIAVVVKNAYEIFFPNAFSPNGDGINDLWLPIDFGAAGEIEILIFNRWGEKVFETNDILKGWDGSYKGAILPPDTYLYFVKGVFLNDMEFDETGTIALVR